MLLYLGEEILCYNVSEKLTQLTMQELYYSLVRFFFCINVGINTGKYWNEILENTRKS